jgi:L-ascorbate metabolism protein UlaG (beta-lactamase superfamily)
VDIEFFGANCVRLTTKKATIVVDDNLAHIGGKSITRPGDVTVATQDVLAVAATDQLAIRTPGEFEIMGVSIHGIGTRAHIDEPGKKTATMYKFVAEGSHILVTGHIFPELDEAQLDAIGRIDVMIIPIGGNGYTLDPLGAVKIIRKIEPPLNRAT